MDPARRESKPFPTPKMHGNSIPRAKQGSPLLPEVGDLDLGNRQGISLVVFGTPKKQIQDTDGVVFGNDDYEEMNIGMELEVGRRE